MENFSKLIVILIVYFVECEDSPDNLRPPRCHSSPELLYRPCCLFPPFFTRDVARGCGAIFELLMSDSATKSTGIRRVAYDNCKYWSCLLKIYDLMGSGDSVDDVRYFAHLDKWVELNPQFANVMPNAKMHCKQLFSMDLPIKACEFHNFHKCVRRYIDVYCPVIISTELCNQQKDFYAECAEYYI